VNSRSSSPHRLWPALGLAVLAAAAPVLAQQSAAPAKVDPPITIEAVLISPQAPGPDTLCKLAVRLKNRSARTVTAFGFEVKVNGHDLTIYGNQRYLEPIPPGETRELQLYNFWSTETDRPALKDGKVEVEVALAEARFVEKTMEGNVPVWTLQDLVQGLPSRAVAKSPFAEGPKR